MGKLFREIGREVKRQIRSGRTPQETYESVSEEYVKNEQDACYLHKRIAQKVKCTVLPENQKEFGFSYHLYIISLFFAVVIVVFSKQHRLEALGISSVSSFSQLLAFLSINFFAWIYLVLAIRSLRFHLQTAYWSLFFSGADLIRLAVLLPVNLEEMPFFTIVRIIPPFLIFIFGMFFVINCANQYNKDKSGTIVFHETKKKYHLDRGWKKNENLEDETVTKQK